MNYSLANLYPSTTTPIYTVTTTGTNIDDDEWEVEEITIIRRRKKAKPVEVQPWPEVKPWIPWPNSTGTITQPCAFDNLPPGVYGLVCSCPKHSVIC